MSRAHLDKNGTSEQSDIMPPGHKGRTLKTESKKIAVMRVNRLAHKVLVSPDDLPRCQDDLENRDVLDF